MNFFNQLDMKKWGVFAAKKTQRKKKGNHYYMLKISLAPSHDQDRSEVDTI